MIEHEEYEARLLDLQMLEKQGNVAKTVLTKVIVHGITARESLQCDQRQLHYLGAEPIVAATPFPAYLKKVTRAATVEDTWPATSLWAKLSGAVLGDAFCQ